MTICNKCRHKNYCLEAYCKDHYCGNYSLKDNNVDEDEVIYNRNIQTSMDTQYQQSISIQQRQK